MKEEVTIKGYVKGVIEYDDGKTELIEFPNTILRKGRGALASSLANEISGEGFDFYISRMLFGDGGTAGGATKFVNTNRNGLFGVTRANKSVISQVDPNIPTMVTFTSVITRSEANGATLNEMALQMNNGDLYSMATFPDLTKTEQMQLTWSWAISFV